MESYKKSGGDGEELMDLSDNSKPSKGAGDDTEGEGKSEAETGSEDKASAESETTDEAMKDMERMQEEVNELLLHPNPVSRQV